MLKNRENYYSIMVSEGDIGKLILIAEIENPMTKYQIIKHLDLTMGKTAYNKIDEFIKIGILQPNGNGFKPNIKTIVKLLNKHMETLEELVNERAIVL